MSKPWVDGWLMQAGLLVMAVMAMWRGDAQGTLTLLVGAMVIGVLRQIERTRRG